MSAGAGTVLVTGATGYLGGAVVDACVAAGREVVGTWHRRPPDPAAADGGASTEIGRGHGSDGPGAGERPAADLVRARACRASVWRRLDVTDRGAVEAALAEVRPELVVHTAYVESGPDLWAVTAEGAGHVAAAAAAVGARVVHVSSDVVLGGRCGVTYGDDAPCDPRHDYGRAKAAAERLVLDAVPGALVARTSLIVGGVGGRPGRQERLVADAAAGRADVTFFDDEIRCPVRVTDLAGALLALDAAGVTGTRNVAGADSVSRAELARLLAAAAGIDPAAIRTGPTPPHLADRPRCMVLDSRVAAALHPLPGVRSLHG